MKHFGDARLDLLTELRDVGPEVARICAIFDLNGRSRILAEPAAGQDPKMVSQSLQNRFSRAADAFWTNEVWIQDESTTPSRREVYECVWSEARPEPPGQDRSFLLDRRFSKDAWFGTPLQSPWPMDSTGSSPLIVSFFSFKGGVGRTTALAATAIQLARAGKRVVVIDFDVESPGIGTLFHSSTGGNARCGVVDYLLEKSVLQGRLEIQDYYHLCDDPKIIQDGTEIAVVPAGVVDDMYLEKLARVNYEFLYRTAEVASGDVSPLHQLLKQLRNSCRPDFVLIDSRAGFHDLGGLSLSGLAHWHVILGLPSEQSWQGLAVAIAQLGRHRVLAGLMQRECLVVQAMGAPSGEFRERQVREFRERSFDLFAENYFDPQQSDSSEWPVPDPESIDSPHFPAVISWDSRVAGYSHLADVADFLCEGEYRRLVATLLERSGRSNT